MSLTPDETLEENEDISTSTIIPTTDISASDNEDSDFPSVLEVVGYLAALPLLLAISPFLMLLSLAVILLPLLAGSSFLLIVMVLAGSFAIMLPVLLGMPALFLPILLLAVLDGEQKEVLFEVGWHKVNRCLARYSPRATTTNRPTNRALNKPAWPGPN